MKAKIDWKVVGQFVGLWVKFSTIVSRVFKEAKLGFEVLEWLVGDGKNFLTKKLGEVIEEYKRYYPEKPVLQIDRSKPFDPKKFIGEGWSIWRGPANGDGLTGREEQDERSLAITTFDCSKIILQSGLRDGETAITGEEKRARLLLMAIQADAKIAQVLYEEEGQKTLRWVYNTLKVSWFELLGTTLRGPGGSRYALYLYRYAGGSWDWSFCWLGRGRGAGGPALGFAS